MCTDQGVTASRLFSREAVSSIPWMILGKILQFGIFFSISICVARALTKEDYGLYSLLMSCAEVGMVVSSLGLHAALLRFIPEWMALQQKVTTTIAIRKALLWEAGAVVVLFAVGTLVLYSVHFHVGQLDAWAIALLVLLLTGSLLLKDFTSVLATALFLSKEISFYTALQGITLLGCVALVTTVNGVVLGTAVSFGLFVVLLGRRVIKVLSVPGTTVGPSSLCGVSANCMPDTDRLFSFSLASCANALLNRLSSQCTELFFLGIFASLDVVGYYALGFSQSLLVMTFIPLSLQTLFTSATAQSYAKNPAVLPRIIESVFFVLILVLVPISAWLFWYAPFVFTIVFSAKMAPAGCVASYFCLIHLMNLFSFPLSLGIQAKEAVRQTLPLQIAFVVCNVVYDILLIPPFHMWGAVAAVFCTFVTTLPYRLYLVRRYVGGIYFPGFFFLKITAISFLGAFGTYAVTGTSSILPVIMGFISYVALLAVAFLFLVTEKEKNAMRQLS